MNITVNLIHETGLEQALAEAGVTNPESIKQLSIIGKMNQNDFEHLINNTWENLQVLDLSNVAIEENKIGTKKLSFAGLKTVAVSNSITEIDCRLFRFCDELMTIFYQYIKRY